MSAAGGGYIRRRAPYARCGVKTATPAHGRWAYKLLEPRCLRMVVTMMLFTILAEDAGHDGDMFMLDASG